MNGFEKQISPLRKIDFAIAGMQKSSTTALALYMDQHPGVYITPGKELHVFKRWPVAPAPTREHIDAKLKNAQDFQLCGDATPLYLYWPQSLEMMRDHNPDMKLIISLRHPVARAYSGWSMEMKRGRETLDFSACIREGRERVQTEEKKVHLIYSYVERGFYSEQIERALDVFPREQLFFLRADHVKAGHNNLQKVLKFIGAPPHQFVQIEGNIFPSSLPTVSESLKNDFAYLQNLYRQDMQKIQALTGLDVSDWLSKPPDVGDQKWS